jgi:hypothetical protein
VTQRCYACGRSLDEKCGAFEKPRPAWPHPRRWHDPVPVLSTVLLLMLAYGIYYTWTTIVPFMRALP